MSVSEPLKNAANAAVAAAPAVSYLSDASFIVTIIAGIFSTIWVVLLTLKMLFPEPFHRFIQMINGRKLK